jgi:hypothetical protein
MSKNVEPHVAYLAGALQALLPHMTFQVYLPRLVVSEATCLYLFGFLDRDTLIGGYRMPPVQVEADLELHLLHASLFFHESWAAEVPRFYPASVREIYTAHRAGGKRLRRVV